MVFFATGENNRLNCVGIYIILYKKKYTRTINCRTYYTYIYISYNNNMARTHVINVYDNSSTNIACRYCNNNYYDEFSKERPVVLVHVCQWNNIDNERNYDTVQLYTVIRCTCYTCIIPLYTTVTGIFSFILKSHIV